MQARSLISAGTLRVLLGLAVCGLAAPVRAQDVIYFANGDRLSGKIKSLGQGQMIVDAPTMDGDAHIGWRLIDRIESERYFQFQTRDGSRFNGRIAKDSGPGASPDEVRIIMPDRDVRIRQEDIVSASQTTRGDYRWIEAHAGMGVSLAKSNNQKQFNVDASLLYQTTYNRITSTINTLYSTQTSSVNTSRGDLNFGYARNITRNWLAGALAGFQQSQEQKLDLRVIVGGGPIRVIVNNGKMRLLASGGVILNHENYQADSGNEQPVVKQAEGMAGMSFALFRFKKLTLESSFRVFPGITVSGRVRGDFNNSLRIKLVRAKGLWWNLSTGLMFDSHPPTNGKGTDYVTTTSVSYSFP